jgi:hypothetical protein
MLASGSNPVEAVGFFERKNSQHAFGGEVKPSVPCRSFAACKKIPYDFRGSRDRKDLFDRPFLAYNSTFH